MRPLIESCSLILHACGRVVGKATQQYIFPHVRPVRVATFTGCRPWLIANLWAKRIANMMEIAKRLWFESFHVELKFQAKKMQVKIHAVVRANVKLAVWAAAEPSMTSAQIFCTDHIKCTDLVHFFVRNKLNTRKVSSLNTSPSVFWYRGRLNRLSGLLLARPFLPLSLPVSHFCRMFLLSWVPIVHTLSWLASQGCCWLLGPLIGSSCALAFLTSIGLAFAWFSLL